MMAVFRCKMCGGALDVNVGDCVAVCECCGTRQTLPRLDDERRGNLYDRANHFRRNNEFDKAMSIYEQILNEDRTDAEAYWSLVLCRYGIEYVEDPASRRRLPTVNRAQFTSVFDDSNYKSALQYADPMRREIYEAEARAINEIQKGILAISQKEAPFDVFICYKETDRNGRRTPDSVLANELYHQLVQEGFKVFFSRITLEDKLGSAYEPYIFAALNSAKVMVVLGTRAEYFNAVWVKNEWSRYLSLIKQGEKKILIPAYRDMDPYDLPEEFSHLQAQDMSKLGFMQDLIRGIQKIAQPNGSVSQPSQPATAANIAPLLKRAFMFLEDREWNSANEYCEKVLDQDPECAQAYLGKLMAELRVQKKEELKNQAEPFDGKNNYQKVMRFGDEMLKSFLNDAVVSIKTRNEKERLDGTYVQATVTMDKATSASAYLEAARIFQTIASYKNSANLAKECIAKAETARKDAVLLQAKSEMVADTISGYESAIRRLSTISGWKDADSQVAVCKNRIADLKAKAEADRLERQRRAKAEEEARQRKAEKDRLEREQKEESDRLERERRVANELRRKRKKKKITVAILCSIVVLAAVIIIILNGKYSDAISLMEEGKYAEAIGIFETLNGYKDSENMITECIYCDAAALAEVGNLQKAAIRYGNVSYYKDARARSMELWAQIAVRDTVSAGVFFALGLKSDGTVVAVGRDSDGLLDVSTWTDIVAVSAGGNHSVGLKSDGTVVAVGYDGSGCCDVSGWTDVIAVSAGLDHTVGLKIDGTVVAVGYNYDDRCEVSGWTDVIAVSAGFYHTVGLKIDGTVVAVGSNADDRCDVSGWTDIVAVSAGTFHTVGLKSDGTVVAVGDSDHGQCDVSGWTDIVAVSAGPLYTIGLKSDGTVVTAGEDCDRWGMGKWTEIVAISAGEGHTVGLKSNGEVVVAGHNIFNLCQVFNWKDMKVRKQD